MRSVSTGSHFVDLTADGPRGNASNSAAFVSNQRQSNGPRDIIDIDDEDGERPAKKAKITGSSLRASPEYLQDSDDEYTSAVVGTRALDAAHVVRPGSPLGPPPKSNAAASHIGSSKPNKLALRKADGIHPPPMATRLPPPKNVADFSPWTGHHPEDVMNEQVVKTGYYDKGPTVTQNESNSARHTIWPNLSQKNNIGLQTLSHLFTQVLEKRQAMGRCTAPSSFKPPPRVTVTDTKREAWLRDLADLNVPLRKQSRTIPHGIRGKLLMEQCLGKNIPLQRAVWLAKCVGANELRAFRRKGVPGPAAASGESKWVHEWTVHVEQFLDSIVAMAGSEGWQSKINYAIKLATAFYSEHLLDTEHYLDWVVTSFASSTMERLPFWIIVVQIYWKDLVGFTKRGRCLAEAILERLLNITNSTGRHHDELKARLQKLVAVLAVTNRGCLVLPKTWEKYKHLLTPQAAAPTGIETTASNIFKRNERLAAPLRNSFDNARSPLVQLYRMLDSIALTVDIEDIASRASALMPDTSNLIAALLDWVSTPYRHGLARVYLIASIIARLHADGNETDEAILQYIGKPKTVLMKADHIHKIVAELVRLNAFSVGRYLQWLITSGALSAGSSYLATSLLPAIPTSAVPRNLQNLRRTLANRAGLAVDEEAAAEHAILTINDGVTRDEATHVELPTRMNTMAISQLSEWVVTKADTMGQDDTLSVNVFCTFRDVLENLQDASALAQLAEKAMGIDSTPLLAAVVDTVNSNAEVFAALGRFDSLLDILVERYRTLRTQQPLDRTFIVALSSLMSRIPGKASVVTLLAHDLTFCEQQQALAVCSPASDNIMGMHASNLDSDDDIDAVFASGNTMDEQLMRRVFARIAVRAEKPSAYGDETSSRLSGWVNQLRSVDVAAFDKLVREYLQVNTASRAEALHVVSTLIASGCLGMAAAISSAAASSTQQAASTALKLATSPSAVNPGWPLSEQYRYRLQQHRFCAEQTSAITSILGKALEYAEFGADDENIHEILIDLGAKHPGSILRAFTGVAQSQIQIINAGRLSKALLRRGFPESSDNFDLEPATLISSADPLSVPFCVNFLRYSYGRCPGRGAPADDMLKHALRGAVMIQSPVWPQLLAAADRDTLGTIHAWAVDRLLSSSETPSNDDNEKSLPISRYIEIADATYSAIKHDDDAHAVGSIADKLTALAIAEQNDTAVGSDAAAMASPSDDTLEVLIHLCILHLSQRTESEGSRQARSKLVAALCGLLVLPNMQMRHSTLQLIFDVASGYVETLPEEAVAALVLHFNTTSAPDARIRSLLGNAATPDAWLALSSKVQPPGSQQQRLLSKQPSQSQIAGPSGMQPTTRATQPGQQQHKSASQQRQEARTPIERRNTAYPLRRWEVISDPTPVMGENDTSLSLGLFGARKV